MSEAEPAPRTRVVHLLPGCTPENPYGLTLAGKRRRKPSAMQLRQMKKFGLDPATYGPGASPRELTPERAAIQREQMVSLRQRNAERLGRLKAQAEELWGPTWKKDGKRLKDVASELARRANPPAEPAPAATAEPARRGLEVKDIEELVRPIAEKLAVLDDKVEKAGSLIRRDSFERKEAQAAKERLRQKREAAEAEKAKAEQAAAQEAAAKLAARTAVPVRATSRLF